MVNWFQRLLYLISNGLPVIMTLALVWALKYHTWKLSMSLLIVAFGLSMIFIRTFECNKMKLSKKSINVTGLSSADGWIVGYCLAYLLPLVTIKFEDYIVEVGVILLIIVVLVTVQAIFIVPNFLLFINGYHFYNVNIDGGIVKDYLLISRVKKIRNEKAVRVAGRMFEKLLVDMERI